MSPQRQTFPDPYRIQKWQIEALEKGAGAREGTLEKRGSSSTPKPTAAGKKDDEEVVRSYYHSSNVKKAKLQSTLSALLSDPVLADVPKNPSLSDVDNLISLELGSAMRVSVLKLDGSNFNVAMMNSATVKVLKAAIKRKVTEMEQSKMGHHHISWRHMWANFALSHHNQKLIDDNSPLQDFGIHNNSQVNFVPYLVAKASANHSRRKKHGFFHGLAHA